MKNDDINIDELISEIQKCLEVEKLLTPEEREFIEDWNATIGKYTDGHEKV